MAAALASLTRILFVDNEVDSPIHCTVIRAHNEGSTVDHATSPAVALDYLRNHQYDIMLIGAFSGCVDTVKTALAIRNVPLVVMAKETELPLARQCIQNGAFYVFKKPVHSAVMDTLKVLAWLWQQGALQCQLRNGPPDITFGNLPNHDSADAVQWDFRVFQYDLPHLVLLVINMMIGLGVIVSLNLNTDHLVSFIVSVAANYHDNPYHCFKHAFDVCQAAYMMLEVGGAKEHLPPLEIFALLCAALMHDVDHPGLTNAFLSTTNSHLALRYNDKSILENHHASVGYQLVLKSRLLEPLNAEEGKTFRSLVIEAILATDFARHIELVTKFKQIVNREVFNRDNPQHRIALICSILKAADVSNPTRPWELAKSWAYRIQEEFWLQGDKERQLGLLPIASGNDRQAEGFSVAKNQINFAQFVMELHSYIVDFLPNLSFMRTNLDENMRNWDNPTLAEPLGGEHL